MNLSPAGGYSAWISYKAQINPMPKLFDPKNVVCNDLHKLLLNLAERALTESSIETIQIHYTSDRLGAPEPRERIKL